MNYCKKCVYPISAVGLSLSEEGICSACEAHEVSENSPEADWGRRKDIFEDILENRLSTKKEKGNYDCVIGVSGGKDSFFQANKMSEDYKLKPLLVTYHGNNYLPEGDFNRDLMRQVLDADHLVFGPSVKKLKELNKFGLVSNPIECWIPTIIIALNPAMINRKIIKFELFVILFSK